MNIDQKILFLSDMHSRMYGKDNCRLLNAVREQHPDLILIGGDMIVGMAELPYKHALKFVCALTEICPVVYANGNHELRLKLDEDGPGGKDYQYYRDELIKSGVIYLENSYVTIPFGKNKIRVYGLDLPFKAFKKFYRFPLNKQDVTELLGTVPRSPESGEENCLNILLAHNPAYMDAYLDWGADMILSGHLHGGLIRIPFIGGIITPQGFLLPKYSGEMTRKGSQTVIVSRGLGTHTLNIRLFNTPELVSIHLTGTANGKCIETETAV